MALEAKESFGLLKSFGIMSAECWTRRIIPKHYLEIKANEY